MRLGAGDSEGLIVNVDTRGSTGVRIGAIEYEHKNVYVEYEYRNKLYLSLAQFLPSFICQLHPGHILTNAADHTLSGARELELGSRRVELPQPFPTTRVYHFAFGSGSLVCVRSLLAVCCV